MTRNWKPVALSLLQHLEAQELTPYAIFNGEERIDTWSADFDARREEMIKELCAVDAAHLFCERGSYVVTLYLVFGNEPEELVADWDATSESSHVQRVTAALYAFENQWSGIPCPIEDKA